MRSLIANTNILLDIATYYKGFYGRIIVLVNLCVGCTVWYAFVPFNNGAFSVEDMSNLYTLIDNYDPFFIDNFLYKPDLFHKITFIDKSDPSDVVISAFTNEFPFSEMRIHNDSSLNHDVRKAACLGLLIAFLITVGMIPTEISDQLLFIN